MVSRKSKILSDKVSQNDIVKINGQLCEVLSTSDRMIMVNGPKSMLTQTYNKCQIEELWKYVRVREEG